MVRMAFRCLVVSMLLIIAAATSVAHADEGADPSAYYLGVTTNAGLDTGYAESNAINQDDVHFGWNLGQFYVNGHTSVVVDDEGNPVFLKTAGDQIKLSFKLDQNIDALNGNAALSINGDANGSDTNFGIPRTDFGEGALIIRQTNHRNETLNPQIYTNYLAGVVQGADTEVQLFEEGDYEVHLNYEVKNDPRKIGPVSIAPSYSNYQTSFKFSVRNGNCMVFPFDVASRSELTNESYAPSGFYLDLARSRYLDVYVKREIMAAGADGLVEDVRFNGPARDGDEYTEEGVYTITASNKYTGQTTVKVIYVGDNPVLKAYAVTGLSIPEINQRVAAGEMITDDGQLVPADAEPNAEQFDNATEPTSISSIVVPIAIIGCCAALVPIAIKTSRKRKVPQEASTATDPNATEPDSTKKAEE